MPPALEVAAPQKALLPSARQRPRRADRIWYQGSACRRAPTAAARESRACAAGHAAQVAQVVVLQRLLPDVDQLITRRRLVRVRILGIAPVTGSRRAWTGRPCRPLSLTKSGPGRSGPWSLGTAARPTSRCVSTTAPSFASTFATSQGVSSPRSGGARSPSSWQPRRRRRRRSPSAAAGSPAGVVRPHARSCGSGPVGESAAVQQDRRRRHGAASLAASPADRRGDLLRLAGWIHTASCAGESWSRKGISIAGSVGRGTAHALRIDLRHAPGDRADARWRHTLVEQHLGVVAAAHEQTGGARLELPRPAGYDELPLLPVHQLRQAEGNARLRLARRLAPGESEARLPRPARPCPRCEGIELLLVGVHIVLERGHQQIACTGAAPGLLHRQGSETKSRSRALSSTSSMSNDAIRQRSQKAAVVGGERALLLGRRPLEGVGLRRLL